MMPVSNSTINPQRFRHGIIFSSLETVLMHGAVIGKQYLPYMDEPVAYAWTFDDGNSSSLKSPVRPYLDVGHTTCL